MEENNINTPIQGEIPTPVVVNPVPSSQIPPPIEPAPPSVPQPSGNKKFIILFVLVLVLLTLGISGLFLYQKLQKTIPVSVIESTPLPTEVSTKKSNPIADWKTFSNINIGFSIKHPEYYISEEIKDLGSNVQRVEFKAESGDVVISSFTVSTSPAKLPDYPYDQKPTGKYTLNGIQGIYVELPNGYGDGGNFKPAAQLAVYIENKGKLYKIDFYGVSSVKDETIDQILSTFRFIEGPSEAR